MLGRTTRGICGLAAWCLACASCELVYDVSKLGGESGGEGGSGGSGATAGTTGGTGGSQAGAGGSQAGTGGSQAGGSTSVGGGTADCTGPNEYEHPTTLHCYLYVPNSDRRFADARQDCKDWWPTADLASITSAEEFSFVTVTHTLETHTWTGATDATQEGVYEWVSGEPFSYANWQSGYPNDPDGILDCVDFGIQGFQWQNAPCSSTRHVLCERPPQ